MSRLASRAAAGRLSKERYMMRVVALLVLVWLIVGAIAAFQRGYFTTPHKAVPARARSR